MSLISDALNEAQREANKRRKEGQPALLGENPISAPAVVVAPPYRPWGRILVYGAIGVVVASTVGGIIAYRRAKAQAEIARADTAAAPVNTAAPSVVATSSATRSEIATNSIRPPVASPTRREPAVPVTTPQPAATRRLPLRASSAATNASTNPPAPSTPTTVGGREPIATTPPQPEPRAPQQDMRVIVDPTVLRSGDSLFIRAYAEHTRGNLDAAADLYERALTKPPVSPELYNDYGALLATRGKHAAAIAMYNLGIAANDKDARLWANLADSYRAMGRRADAMSAYFEAMKLDPMNIGVRLRLAGEYALLGDTASARRGFEEAVRSAPNDAEAHYRYGVFLQTQHDVGGTIRELQTFVDLAPGKYPTDVIDRTKAYIANLRRLNR